MTIPLLFLSLFLLWRGTHWIIPLVCNCYAGSALFLSWQEAFTPVFNDSCHKCQDTRYFFRNFLAWSAGVLQPSVKLYSTSLLNLALYYYYQSKIIYLEEILYSKRIINKVSQCFEKDSKKRDLNNSSKTVDDDSNRPQTTRR